MDNKTKFFLNRIRNIESSSGKDTKHSMVTKSGIQKGETAIGDYGLMPNTVKELLNRARMNGDMTPELQELQSIPKKDLKSYLEQRKDIQEQLAERLANRVLSRQGGDEEKAAYSWNQGHNLTSDSITPDKINKSGYVEKFRKLSNVTNIGKSNPEFDHPSIAKPEPVPPMVQAIQAPVQEPPREIAEQPLEYSEPEESMWDKVRKTLKLN